MTGVVIRLPLEGNRGDVELQVGVYATVVDTAECNIWTGIDYVAAKYQSGETAKVFKRILNAAREDEYTTTEGVRRYWVASPNAPVQQGTTGFTEDSMLAIEIPTTVDPNSLLIDSTFTSIINASLSSDYTTIP